MVNREMFVLGQQIAGVIYGFLPVEVTSLSGLMMTLEELEIQLDCFCFAVVNSQYSPKFLLKIDS